MSYLNLIKEAEGTTYLYLRLRLALCFPAVPKLIILYFESNLVKKIRKSKGNSKNHYHLLFIQNKNFSNKKNNVLQKITGRLVIDSVDMFLISSFIASQTAHYFKEYSSEESKIKREKVKMDRLKADLIKKSRKIEHASKSTSYSNKIKKIYRVALSSRGGEINDFLIQGVLESEFSTEFTISQRIRDMFFKTLIFMKTRGKNADKLRLIFLVARLGINLILVRCNINIDYVVDDGVPKTVNVPPVLH